MNLIRYLFRNLKAGIKYVFGKLRVFDYSLDVKHKRTTVSITWLKDDDEVTVGNYFIFRHGVSWCI